jgi:hypothetical protein
MNKLLGVIIISALISTTLASFIGYAEGRKDTDLRYQLMLSRITGSSLILLDIAEEQKETTDELRCMFEEFIGYKTSPGEDKNKNQEYANVKLETGEKV